MFSDTIKSMFKIKSTCISCKFFYIYLQLQLVGSKLSRWLNYYQDNKLYRLGLAFVNHS
jgi:hypothetical protein